MTSRTLNSPTSGRTRTRSAPLGVALAIAAAVTLVVSFTTVAWLSDVGPARFGDIRSLLHANSDHVAALATAYFTWLAWALLVAAVAGALIANAPGNSSNAVPIAAAAIADLGIVLTFFSIKFTADGEYSAYLKHATVGFYLAIGGFVLASAGALVGLRRR